MPLRIPSKRDWNVLTEANHFELNEEELEAFHGLIPGMFAFLRGPRPDAPTGRTSEVSDRDPGVRPAARRRPASTP